MPDRYLPIVYETVSDQYSEWCEWLKNTNPFKEPRVSWLNPNLYKDLLDLLERVDMKVKLKKFHIKGMYKVTFTDVAIDTIVEAEDEEQAHKLVMESISNTFPGCRSYWSWTKNGLCTEEIEEE